MNPATTTRPDTDIDYIALVITPGGDVQPLCNPVATVIPRVIGHTDSTTISLNATTDLWFDQHAAFGYRPVNPLAIAIATALTDIPTVIYGPAMIASHTDSGTFTGLSPRDLAQFMAWYRTITDLCARHRNG